MIAIIDYDAGNIKSVEKALQKLGQDVVITREKQQILAADKVILPGVGAFGDAMKNLDEYGLVEVIEQVVEKRIPFLGICLGLQLLFEKSDESEGVKGLGILKGEVCRIPDQEGFKIPHMGRICIFCAFLLPKSQGGTNCEGDDRIRCAHPCICGNG